MCQIENFRLALSLTAFSAITQGLLQRAALPGSEIFPCLFSPIKGRPDLHYTIPDGLSTPWIQCLTYILEYKLSKDKNHISFASGTFCTQLFSN